MTLRAARRADTGPLHEAITETLPELIRWLPWARAGHRRNDTRRYLRGSRSAWARKTTLEYLLVKQETGQVLGITSIHRIDWTRRCAGLGYWIRASAWNQGFATEAALGTTIHAFERLSIHRLEAHVALNNKNSQRVVEKIGFQREGVARDSELLDGHYLDHIQYGLLHTDVFPHADCDK